MSDVSYDLLGKEFKHIPCRKKNAMTVFFKDADRGKYHIECDRCGQRYWYVFDDINLIGKSGKLNNNKIGGDEGE